VAKRGPKRRCSERQKSVEVYKFAAEDNSSLRALILP